LPERFHDIAARFDCNLETTAHRAGLGRPNQEDGGRFLEQYASEFAGRDLCLGVRLGGP
jgi:hypothetical protein